MVPIATGFEEGAQTEVVVDLPIENNRDRTVGGCHGLMARGRQIDNGEPSESKSDSSGGIYKGPGIVRSTMNHHVAHSDEELLVDGLNDGAIV